MSDLNPYQILGSLFHTGHTVVRTVKEQYTEEKTVTKGRGKNKTTTLVPVTKTRVKKDEFGNPIYVGGCAATSFVMGNLEVCLTKKNGDYFVNLFEISTGTATNKIPFEEALRMKLLHKLSKGVNVWAAFNG